MRASPGLWRFLQRRELCASPLPGTLSDPCSGPASRTWAAEAPWVIMGHGMKAPHHSEAGCGPAEAGHTLWTKPPAGSLLLRAGLPGPDFRSQTRVCWQGGSSSAAVSLCPCVSPQAITTEGKYWKSRIEIVIREYHKWRTYFKKRVSGSGSKESTFRKPRRGGKK